MTGLPDVSLVFQAIVDLNSGVAAGYEVLARFQGALPASPDRWLAAADDVGLGARMECAIWNAAFEVRDRLPLSTFLSVNASPDFLASSECEALMGSRTSLDGIVIEVTEHEAITDYDRLSATLSRYRSRGASVAVDDAGAGYASMSHILALRPEFIKLDRAIVTDCDRDPAKAALVEMVDSFAGRTGSQLVAEGVETEGELATLTRMGVPMGQGYFLSRPQADCSAPSPAVSSFLLLKARLRIENSSLRPFIETVPAVAREDEAFYLLTADPRPDIAVVTSGASRTFSVVLRRGRRLTLRPGAMRVDAGSDARDVLQRAMSRDIASRFDPIVCADGDGSLLGILRIERLVEYLAKHRCSTLQAL